ncbi:MAG: MBL fold metallo-hydrolase [Actinobacteria bacterium]|nr:MBL fold metallo-hydrolase [Actinomycetota bacterium]
MTTRSFDPTDANVVTAPNGARVHRDHLAQNAIIRREFYEVRPGAWCFVGNGLSNQTFIDAPEGIIAFDTGESVQEMALALAELRTRTDRPIAAVVYTHFHYVEGTQAVLDEGNHAVPLPIFGHRRIALNKARTSGEIAPAYGRGLVEQFAIVMPQDGPDGLVNVGLGFSYRNPAHAPATPGYLPVTRELPDEGEVTIAGERVLVRHSPSDSDDSVNFFFPRTGVCVHNTVWPLLFNVFAIRGEEYRDPRVLIPGIENIIAWAPEHLIATHGPPLSGRDDIRTKSERYRDSIQFMWDQTVRAINKGWTMDEIAARVALPPLYDQDYLTSERYGVAEHHLRQIYTGLRGWFDGEESKLFPLEPGERFARLIEGFGGRAEVARQASAALDSDDIRWGVEMATWLVRSDGATDADRGLLARGLRLVAERTPAANIRNWAITRARHLDGQTPMDRFMTHSFGAKTIAHAASVDLVHTLRVLLDPAKAEGVSAHLRIVVDGEAAGLLVRNCVAVPTDGTGAAGEASMTRATFVAVLSGKQKWSEADIAVSGDASVVDTVRRCLDHATIPA